MIMEEKLIFKITNKNKVERSIIFNNVFNCYFIVVAIWKGQYYYQKKKKTLKAAIDFLYDDILRYDISFLKSSHYKLETETIKATAYSDRWEYGYLKYPKEKRRGFNSVHCALDCFIYNHVGGKND